MSIPATAVLGSQRFMEPLLVVSDLDVPATIRVDEAADGGPAPPQRRCAQGVRRPLRRSSAWRCERQADKPGPAVMLARARHTRMPARTPAVQDTAVQDQVM